VSLKRRIESLEREIKSLSEPVNEEEKLIIVQLLGPLHKSNEVLLEGEDGAGRELPQKPEGELSEREIEERLKEGEKKALKWVRENVDLRLCERAFIYITPWEWVVQVPELGIDYESSISTTSAK